MYISHKSCCESVEGTLVTTASPATAGEIVVLYATGLGLPVLSDGVEPYIQSGLKYPANAPITVPQSLLSALAGGATAEVLQASLVPGMVGLYEVIVHLGAGLSTEPETSIELSQGAYLSNDDAFPLVNSAGLPVQRRS